MPYFVLEAKSPSKGLVRFWIEPYFNWFNGESACQELSKRIGEQIELIDFTRVERDDYERLSAIKDFFTPIDDFK